VPAKARKQQALDRATQNWLAGESALYEHPLFAPLASHASITRREGNLCPKNGWIVVTSEGWLYCHPTRLAEPEEWTCALAHGLLHLGFGHFAAGEGKRPREWTAACCSVVNRLLRELKLGKVPTGLGFLPDGIPTRSEEALYRHFCEVGVPADAALCAPAGLRCDAPAPQATSHAWGKPPDWEALFGQGLADAVTSAVEVAAGKIPDLGSFARSRTEAQRAMRWFISSYPLFGSLAAHFEIVEDPVVCHRLEVDIAAVDEQAQEIYVNPLAGLDERECRFVLAHELLHAGLRHAGRRQGRDPYLWNVACDFVINGWLVEMGVGDPPSISGLYDPTLQGESAESVYDRLVTDLRRSRKLRTLRGHGLGDILEREPRPGEAWSLDDICRRALCQGLAYHEQTGRGLLPAGLVEEIRALSQPPIPWDVELARWFAHYFPPVEKTRTYGRPSRRQSATPDIPRPRWVPPPPTEMARTFGVVLDTSGSMDRTLLGRALGAIASYSLAREVPAARVVFCDAFAYDQGYMPPDAILDRVRVRGRGGTVLQPGIDLLERAADFPKTGPILVITDGMCDIVRIRRDHAFLLPEGHSLPFLPKGPVFRVK
jgi:predicted metal-dependent peptidase